MALTPDLPSRQPSVTAARLMLLLFIGSSFGSAVRAEPAKNEVEAAKRALDLKIYRATTDALVARFGAGRNPRGHGEHVPTHGAGWPLGNGS